MDIGEQVRVIIVEPIEIPIEIPIETPEPVPEPVPVGVGATKP